MQTYGKIYCTARFVREGFRETRLPGEPQLAYGNKQKPSRNEGQGRRRRRKRRREEAVPLRSLSRKLAKEDGESFHLRAASEVGANGGLKSFAIERRRNRSSLSS